MAYHAEPAVNRKGGLELVELKVAEVNVEIHGRDVVVLSRSREFIVVE